jgi:hypothetical protein
MKKLEDMSVPMEDLPKRSRRRQKPSTKNTYHSTVLKNETTMMPLDATPAHLDSQYNLPSIIYQVDEPDQNFSSGIYD